MKIDIYPVGSRVIFGGDIEGMVTAVTIRSSNLAIVYEIGWWDGRECRSANFIPEEITGAAGPKVSLAIGFKSGVA